MNGGRETQQGRGPLCEWNMALHKEPSESSEHFRHKKPLKRQETDGETSTSARKDDRDKEDEERIESSVFQH